MAAGEPLGITPYGTEAMHVLRAEKGYPIVGQETDGTVTPIDLGMDWIVSKQKSFVGKRSLARSDTVAAGPQAAGRTAARGPRRAAARGRPARGRRHPRRSRCPWSATSRRAIGARRSVERSRWRWSGRPSRIGERVYAPLPDRTIAATIHDSVLFDPENPRRDGEPATTGEPAT